MADADGEVGRTERQVFEQKLTYTHLRVFEVVEGGRTYHRFELVGSYRGEGSTESWACANRYRCTNAGKNNQARMEAGLSKRNIVARGFRGRF